MGRYYFHVRRGQVTILDQKGIELAGVEKAAQEAVQRAEQIEVREALTDLPPSNGMIVVENDFHTVFEVPIGGARGASHLRGGVFSAIFPRFPG